MTINKTPFLLLSKIKTFILSRKSDFVLSLYMLIRQRRYSFFLHWVNLVLSKATHVISKRNIKTVSTGNFLLNRYVIVNGEFETQPGDKKLTNDLLNVTNFMESTPKGVDKTTKYVLLGNFSFIQNSIENQTHFDDIPADLLSSLANSFRNSEIFAIAQSVSGCQLTVCNLRCWLFFPRSKSVDENINPHIDWFPPGFLKVMFYKGNFTKDTPAINVHQDGKVIPVVGANPLLLFDSNRVTHSAPAPIRGCRPTAEFTLMPQGFSKYQLLQAGFQTGYPINPFKSYSHAYSMLSSQ